MPYFAAEAKKQRISTADVVVISGVAQHLFSLSPFGVETAGVDRRSVRPAAIQKSAAAAIQNTQVAKQADGAP